MVRGQIQEGDIVKVKYYSQMWTLTDNGKVLNVPVSTDDSWIIEDMDTGDIHYISEGCTITKPERSKSEI